MRKIKPKTRILLIIGSILFFLFANSNTTNAQYQIYKKKNCFKSLWEEITIKGYRGYRFVNYLPTGEELWEYYEVHRFNSNKYPDGYVVYFKYNSISDVTEIIDVFLNNITMDSYILNIVSISPNGELFLASKINKNKRWVIYDLCDKTYIEIPKKYTPLEWIDNNNILCIDEKELFIFDFKHNVNKRLDFINIDNMNMRVQNVSNGIIALQTNQVLKQKKNISSEYNKMFYKFMERNDNCTNFNYLYIMEYKNKNVNITELTDSLPVNCGWKINKNIEKIALVINDNTLKHNVFVLKKNEIVDIKIKAYYKNESIWWSPENILRIIDKNNEVIYVSLDNNKKVEIK